MALIKEKKQHKIIESFLNGASAEDICRHHKITPLQLIELFNSTQLVFVNELFDLPSEDQKMTLSQVEYENVQLKKEQEMLVRQIKDYEIEIRIHKEVLETLIKK